MACFYYVAYVKEYSKYLCKRKEIRAYIYVRNGTIIQRSIMPATMRNEDVDINQYFTTFSRIKYAFHKLEES